MENLPPFYVGQRVVRTGKSFKGICAKGGVYTVKHAVQCSCGKTWLITCFEWPPAKSVGDIELTGCGCEFVSNGCYYGKAIYFAPVQENFQSITLEKVLETETPLISVN